jgi:catechol 2,3-dioxygenase-like lactoylglutathione lyase family enzyme
MSSTQSPPIDMALEVVAIPVLDIDRTARFYTSLGWRLDADIVKGDAFRLLQFTPPGSACSIHFGKGITSVPAGTAGANYLVVSDNEAAHRDLVARGVDVSEIFHDVPGGEYLNGVDPQRKSYASFASFKDPDGNAWVVQEVTVRLPGRVATDQGRKAVPR